MAFKKIIASSVNLIPYGMRPFIKRTPGLAQLQRMILERHMRGQPFIHGIHGGPANGLVFEVTLPVDKDVWTGLYELEFTSAIAAHIKAGDICYDIGAYRGYISGVMALSGAARVFSLEPLPANQTALRRLAQLNPRLPLALVPFAAANFDGPVTFRMMQDSSMGKLASSAFQWSHPVAGETTVQARKLDSLIAENSMPMPDVMKIDVEGAEMDVLMGAERTIQQAHPKIFIETHSAELKRTCSQYLGRFGYSVRILPKGGAEPHVDHVVCLPG